MSNIEIQIRLTTIEDLKQIVPVHMRAWKQTYKGIIDQEYLDLKTAPENYPERIARWEKSFGTKEGEIFLVAERNNQIVGFVLGGEPRGFDDIDKEIQGLYVDPDYHQLGIGKKLFNAFADIVRKDGATSIVIGCLKDNASTGFYKAIGGTVLKEGFWEYEKGKLPELFFVFDISTLD